VNSSADTNTGTNADRNAGKRAGRNTGKNARVAKKAADESAAKQRLRLWIRMLRTTRAVEAELREHLRTEFGSTLPRFDVMSALSRYDHGIKMSELSRLLMVSNGNVTGIVERLADEGLLLREADPQDRRATHVRLTSKGIAEFERQAIKHQDWLNDCLSGISADESATITKLLSQATK